MLVIGDELLSGYVTDVNTPLLAQRLRDHGVPLTCVHTVADDLAAIDEALTLELSHPRPRLIVTSGGIGSTPDDLTYEAVAASLDRSLVEDPTMAGRIDEVLAWSAEQGVEVTEEFAWHVGRMARIPEGSRLLHRPHGWAPGVLVEVDGGMDAGGVGIVILPGIPSEFEALLDGAVLPALVEGRGDRPHVLELTHRYPESLLNLGFVEVMARFPEVKLGSYPGRPMIIRLSGPPEPVEGAAAVLAEYLDDLDTSEVGRRMAARQAARDAQEADR